MVSIKILRKKCRMTQAGDVIPNDTTAWMYDSMRGGGRVASGTKTEQLPKLKNLNKMVVIVKFLILHCAQEDILAISKFAL
jgi:hypothetical protein